MCSILAYCGTAENTEEVWQALKKTASRGPDLSRLVDTGNGLMGFNRLTIMGLSTEAMQPFAFCGKRTLPMQVKEGETYPVTAPEDSELLLICNGEIYGFRPMKEELAAKGYTFISESDCEILPALYREYGTDMFGMLDAEFALVLYDVQADSYIAARDPIGIRPLYYGRLPDGEWAFASEPKNLMGLCETILPFPPGHYWIDGEFIRYADPSHVDRFIMGDEDTVCKELNRLLTDGVKKRLDADAPVGFLLSGGLDSSLVCGVSAKLLDKPLRTFSIGMDIDAIDLKYARKVADYIGSDHYEVIISRDDVIAALEPVIAALGTYDITTIRASIGMYLVCKWIHENTDVRVIMTGEISDEIFGYKYTDFAPDAEAFQKEAE